MLSFLLFLRLVLLKFILILSLGVCKLFLKVPELSGIKEIDLREFGVKFLF